VERVIYISTFSKSFLPSMRLAFMVIPDSLLKLFNQFEFEQTVSRHEQLAVTKFIKDEDWDRHLRRMRKRYKEKHDYFINVFQETFPFAKISSDDAGLRFQISFKTKETETWFIERAKEENILIKSLSQSFAKLYKTNTVSLLIGFGSVEIDEIKTVVEKLKRVWKL
jgi:GntR family transcriptional regulator / MocR family aminotransferase